MEATQLAEMIQTAVLEVFPDSCVNATYDHNLGHSICLRFGLGTKAEWANGIWQNDPAFSVFHIWLRDDGSVPDKISCESDTANTFWTGTERIKVGYRKINSSPEMMALKIAKYFKKLKTVLEENREKISQPYQTKF